MFKNVASTFIVFAFDATTNVPKTGDAANLTAYVKIDAGSVTVLGDTSATELDATTAPGYYVFDAAQAETNGDRLLVTGKSATSNIKVIGAPAVIFTRPAAFGLVAGAANGLLIAGSNAATTFAGIISTAGITVTQSASNAAGVSITGNGSSAGLIVIGGATGRGMDILAGGGAGQVDGILIVGSGTGHGIEVQSGSGATGDGINTSAQSTNGNGVKAAGKGTGNGMLLTGGASAGGDGLEAAAGGGVPIRGDITGNLVGTVSTLTTYTGNTVQTGDNFARLGAPAGASVSADIAAVKTVDDAVKAKTDNLPAAPASTTNITAGTITTVGTLTTYTGNTPQTGDNFARLGAPAGASVSADIAAAKSDTAGIKTKTDSLTFTAAGVVDANMLRTNGDATSAANVAKTTRAIVRVTAAGAASTTSIPTSACSPAGAVADQFKGRILTFDADTATAALRGQATDITASSNSATPTLTVTALTTAPASGDTGSIT